MATTAMWTMAAMILASLFLCTLNITANAQTNLGEDVQQLSITTSYDTDDQLHLLITDGKRWEVPRNLVPRNNFHKAVSPKLTLVYTVNPFSFLVTRTSNGEVIFDSPPTSNFTYKDQYLEISTRIPSDVSLYGLGESTRKSGLRLVPGSTTTLWAADTGASNTDVNLYGSQPFFLGVRKGGSSYGVLLLNSNGMDIEYKDGYLTYKIIGGVMDFYFFAGPSPLAVVQQYTQLVGKPAPMPYWSLGFHQCRWGYKDVQALESVVSRYKEAGLPLEVIWSDIDHMDAFKDFTLDPVNYPQQRMQRFLEKLHADGQKYVLIVDPGIKPEDGYATYERAKAADVFIRGSNGKPYLGQVWPGPVHFPDFLHPNASRFWRREISVFRKKVPFDGLWIDMNEASNFCSGSSCSIPSNASSACPSATTSCCLVCSDEHTKWDDPPYAINNAGQRRSLGAKTIAMSATHHDGTLEYNAHSLYGLAEAKATNRALRSVLKERPFVLTRSNFVGSGSVAAHWTGDNSATWEDLKYSISSILSSGIAGIPMVGADICGFAGNTSEELCRRWIQLGAFYPFCRDHSVRDSIPQELYAWETVRRSAEKALGLRYRLLPHLYTLLFESHTLGSPVARPLFFAFPGDAAALRIDQQLLIGSSILVSPVLEPNRTSVRAYFPAGSWYNLFDYSKVASAGSYHLLDAPADAINVHVCGGAILPMQEAAATTRLARKTPFTLLVAFSGGSSGNESAAGQVFLDDGKRVRMRVEAGKSSLIRFRAQRRGGNEVEISSSLTDGRFAMEQGCLLDGLLVLGANAAAAPRLSVLVNGSMVRNLDVRTMGEAIHVRGFHLCMASPFSIAIKW